MNTPKTDPGRREVAGVDLLPLGAPPFADVEGAARLLLEYRRVGMREETAEVFLMSVHDAAAVLKRAAELEAIEGSSNVT
ncbi:MAG TPA: hypothetical protein VH062_13570 [Polyangiaceae bacterium]|nr:hypothetical protein [Polyangiaceae bacterium]